MKLSIFIAFAIYFLIVIGVGVYFYNKLKNMKDYFLGGRNLNSWVTAMSAQAADMSGWLLMGLPAAAYISGISASWIAIGLAVGTYLNWKIIAQRLRQFSSHMGDSITIPQYLQNRFLTSSPLIRILPAVVIFIFFLIYTASAFNAEAKVFQYLFSIDYTLAVTIGVFVILIYTFLGGFMAACWTDLFQGFLILFAMLIVPILAIKATPDISINTISALNNGTYLNLFNFANDKTAILTIISYFAWGLGYLGMPHILVRFMAIKSSDMIKKARIIAIIWVVLTLSAAVAIGIIGYFYLASKGIIYPDKLSAEIVFIDSAMKIISNGFIVGILLSAVLAAIMSTAASQLLVTASTITNDFYKLALRPNASDKELMIVGRGAVFVTVALAYILAFNPNNSVMNLVSYAWAGFGASFGPVILISLFWKKLSLKGAYVGIFSGAIMVLLWENIPLLKNTEIYSILPAFLVSSILILIVSKLDKPNKEVEKLFNEAVENVVE